MEQHLRSHNLGWIMVLIRLTPAAHLQRARELVATTAFQQLCRLASCCSAGGYARYPAQIILHLRIAQSIQVCSIYILRGWGRIFICEGGGVRWGPQGFDGCKPEAWGCWDGIH